MAAVAIEEVVRVVRVRVVAMTVAAAAEEVVARSSLA